LLKSKWTGRGTGHFPRCHNSYSNAWKPKTCSNCDYEIGGKYVPKTTTGRKKRKLEWPESVLVLDSQLMRIYSVKLDHRSNRVFVVKDNTNVCHHEKCKESRAVHMASAVPFSCAHIGATENSSKPLSAKILNPEDSHAYNCDEVTKKKLWATFKPTRRFLTALPFLQNRPHQTKSYVSVSLIYTRYNTQCLLNGTLK